MKADFTRLTFLANPLAYEAQTGEVCVRVPTGISSAEQLLAILQEGLGLPAYCDNWNVLYDLLRDWSQWNSPPQRVVLLHTDVPLLRSGKLWQIDLQSYLEILIDSISDLQAKKTDGADPSKHRELVVVFPEQAYDDLYAVVTRPPDWELTIGFLDYDALNIVEIDPPRSLVLQDLGYLDGLTAEVCTLRREDFGTITVQYNRHQAAYYVAYTSTDRKEDLVASSEEIPAKPPLVSFDLASQILETFFADGQRSSAVHWSVLSLTDYRELEGMRERWCYRSDEEALLEIDAGHIARATIGEGIREAFYQGDMPFALHYWQQILARPEAPISQRLAAMCLVGRSGLPEALDLLRPFLDSPVKQERWVSAVCCGLLGDEEVLPLLLSMLTDELPVAAQQANEYWYEAWRWYVPRLLRKWSSPEVGEQLRKSLAVWLQAEPQFDHEIDIWKRYEALACYELGYREDVASLADLTLETEHRQVLMTYVERGYTVKKLQMTSQEEYMYQRYRLLPAR